MKKNIINYTWTISEYHRGKDYKTSLYDIDETGSCLISVNEKHVNAYVGLPQFGEIYTGNDLNWSYYYLNINCTDNDAVSGINPSGFSEGVFPAYDWYGVRPVVVLKNNVKIQSGEGTIYNPYSLFYE